MYTGNGIFQTAIQLPIQDAIGKGIEIESGELDNVDIDEIYEYWEEVGLWQTILNFMTWVRLFGGGALLVNTNQKPEKKLSLKNLDKSPLEFYDLDRWQLDTNIAIFDDWDSYLSSVGDGDGIIHLYGEPIHESRFLRGQGKRAPHYVRRQLRGWGMSEGERMIRDLNLYLKTQDSTFELIDEAKIDVYKINGLANKLLTTGGTTAITARIQAANEIKNYVNALVLDANEEYEQKSMTFTGLAEIMNQNRMGVAAALRMPMTKLFGLSASGFNTGESDLENYNAMVESEVRAQLKPIIRKLLKITMSHIFGYVPDFTFKFPSLREQTPEVEQDVKTQETNRLLAIYDRGLMDSEELMQSMRKAGVVQIETKTEQGLNPDPIPPEPSGQTSTLGSTPDGSGPNGRGLGPGQGKADGTGLAKNSRKNAAFKEEEHPRDDAGKFGEGGGGAKKKDDLETMGFKDYEGYLKDKYKGESVYSEATDKEIDKLEKLEKEFHKEKSDKKDKEDITIEEGGDIKISGKITDKNILIVHPSYFTGMEVINPTDSKKVDKIKKSLIKKGFDSKNPILVYDNPGEEKLITGSNRMEAIKELSKEGYDIDIPIIDVSNEVDDFFEKNDTDWVDIDYSSLRHIFEGTSIEKYKKNLKAEW